MTPDIGKHEPSVSEGLQDAAEATARGAHKVAGKVADKAGELRDRGAELASEVRSRADQTFQSLRGVMRDKPLESAAVILAAGWVLGRLLGRRG